MIDFFSLNQLQMLLYIFMIFLYVIGVSFIMEVYKKNIRKDKANKLEIMAIAAVISVLVTICIVKLNMFHPLFAILNGKPIFDEVLFAAVFFVLQMQADMKIVKSLIIAFTRSILQKAGFDNDQVDSIMNSIKK